MHFFLDPQDRTTWLSSPHEQSGGPLVSGQPLVMTTQVCCGLEGAMAEAGWTEGDVVAVLPAELVATESGSTWTMRDTTDTDGTFFIHARDTPWDDFVQLRSSCVTPKRDAADVNKVRYKRVIYVQPPEEPPWNGEWPPPEVKDLSITYDEWRGIFRERETGDPVFQTTRRAR